MAPTPLSRRDLLRRATAGAALTAAAPSLLEAAIAAVPAESSPDSGNGQLRFPIRLSSNHNPNGPSDLVINAMLEAARAADADPEKESELLRDRLADDHRVTRDEVVLAGGSAEILRLAVSAFLPPGKTLLTAEPTFDVMSRYARNLNRQVVSVPLRPDYSHDLDAMLSSCDSTTGLVYVCNPNNPTGSLTPRRDLEAFIAKLPAATHVVIDEAYHHYVDDASDYRSFIDHPIGDRRLIVTRSFSKIHGLVSLRVGYAVASAGTAARLEVHRTSGSISVISSKAAMAALDHADYVRASRMRNADDRQEFFNQANARMVRCLDSQTNFVMVNSGGPAEPVIEHFRSNRIRLPSPYRGFERYIRVSLGTPAEMQEFWRVWGLLPGGGHQHH
jgi:histidinol-phosphate aminotransferase